MRKTVLATTLALTMMAATSVQATNSADKYTFVASDATAETQVCMVAAAQGVAAASEKATELKIDFRNFKNHTKCNGKTVRQFVKSFNKETLTAETMVTAQVVELTAKDGSLESRICVQAAKEGISSARKEHGNNKVNSITCNIESISRFISKLKTKKVM
jgi:hypothetical protein